VGNDSGPGPQDSALSPRPDSVPISIVDAFTATPFSGNPAAVCVLEGASDPGWMQSVAAEMNLSETAFVHVLPEGGGFSLRWFTPAREVELCGHATLASAHVLWEDGHLNRSQPAIFETLSGRLSTRWTLQGIEMDFPLRPVQPADPPPDLLAGLRITPVAVTKDAVNYLVELSTEAQVRELQPDMTALARLPEGVIVTSRSDDPAFDFVSRYFAPSWGIPEDPVTGSAHCSLAPYWRDTLGKDEFIAYQASARGGTVGVRIADDRAVLRGHAVTVLRGLLRE
jgi:predicted PhzF superfamily epimerase YddE/YHI9